MNLKKDLCHISALEAEQASGTRQIISLLRKATGLGLAERLNLSLWRLLGGMGSRWAERIYITAFN